MKLELYDDIIALPFLKSREKFDKVYKNIAKSKLINQET